MSVIISAITGAYAGALAWCGKIFAPVMAKAAALCAKLGLKILSINWIKAIFDWISNVLSVIKRTVFNPKFVTFAKYLSAVVLFALAVVQTVFAAVGLFGNFSVVIESFKSFDLKPICAAFLISGGLVFSSVYCIRFVPKVFHRSIDVRFVGVILLTYVIFLCYHNLVPNGISGMVLDKIKLIDVIGIITAVYAFFSLFDGGHSVSVFGTLLAGIGLALSFVFFGNERFFNFLHYELSGEGGFFVKELNACMFFEAYKKPTSVYGAEGLLATWCAELEGANVFLKSVVITLNLFVIVVCSLLPYLFISAAAGIAISLISDRIKQFVNLNRSLTILRLAFLCSVLAICASFAVALLFKGASDMLVIVAVNTGGAVLTLCGIVVEAIVLAVARKAITDKPYAKLKKNGLK